MTNIEKTFQWSLVFLSFFSILKAQKQRPKWKLQEPIRTQPKSIHLPPPPSHPPSPPPKKAVTPHPPPFSARAGASVIGCFRLRGKKDENKFFCFLTFCLFLFFFFFNLGGQGAVCQCFFLFPIFWEYIKNMKACAETQLLPATNAFSVLTNPKTSGTTEPRVRKSNLKLYE